MSGIAEMAETGSGGMTMAATRTPRRSPPYRTRSLQVTGRGAPARRLLRTHSNLGGRYHHQRPATRRKPGNSAVQAAITMKRPIA
jgi:hypothetical protein